MLYRFYFVKIRNPKKIYFVRIVEFLNSDGLYSEANVGRYML